MSDETLIPALFLLALNLKSKLSENGKSRKPSTLTRAMIMEEMTKANHGLLRKMENAY
jgi:hypothetical protein